MKKNIVFSGNRIQSVQYADLNKHNQAKPIIGVCSYCLECAVFRVIKIDNVNQLACTRCLRSARLYKTEPLNRNRMIRKRKLTLEDKLKRTIYRLHRYFTGDLVHHPFKIKKKSQLGLKITILIIKVKSW